MAAYDNSFKSFGGRSHHVGTENVRTVEKLVCAPTLDERIALAENEFRDFQEKMLFAMKEDCHKPLQKMTYTVNEFLNREEDTRKAVGVLRSEIDQIKFEAKKLAKDNQQANCEAVGLISELRKAIQTLEETVSVSDSEQHETQRNIQKVTGDLASVRDKLKVAEDQILKLTSSNSSMTKAMETCLTEAQKQELLNSIENCNQSVVSTRKTCLKTIEEIRDYSQKQKLNGAEQKKKNLTLVKEVTAALEKFAEK